MADFAQRFDAVYQVIYQESSFPFQNEEWLSELYPSTLSIDFQFNFIAIHIVELETKPSFYLFDFIDFTELSVP